MEKRGVLSIEEGSWTESQEGRLTLRELRGVRLPTTLADDVRTGLTEIPKTLPPKYFYDELGSLLFERICKTPEYYPSRTEEALLESAAREIIAAVRPRTIVELGSGSSRKTAHFFVACERENCPARYLPIDVCGEMLRQAGQDLLARFGWLRIDALIGDYSCGLANLPAAIGPRLFLFLGGTIGNFDESAARLFLADVCAVMQPHDVLVLGADRVKDPSVLHAAYNDAAGLTAAFNRNVLCVINRELQADFDVGAFSHHAWFNEHASQIEMHLRANGRQQADVPGADCTVTVESGETILTEISRKFTPEGLNELLTSAGFSVRAHYQPHDAFFSLMLASPKARD